MKQVRYLLDTNICIYLVKQQPLKVFRKFSQLQEGEVAMSLITLGELSFGIEKSQRADKARQALPNLLQFIPALPLPWKPLVIMHASVLIWKNKGNRLVQMIYGLQHTL
jgi:predicted nucleic acid-binding protein